MLLIYWVPSTIVPTLCMLPILSLAGSHTSDTGSAPAGSLEGDLG
jgi:hypothetical protein